MDYNIYIHGDTSSNNKTSPWKPSESSDSDGFSSSNLTSKTQSALNYAQNPDSLISKGVGALAKALPWVAVAYAAIKVADSVTFTTMSFYSMETGDYRSTVKYNNFKAGVNALLRPVSTTINFFKTQTQIRVDNEKKAATRELFSDDIITGGSVYGV